MHILLLSRIVLSRIAGSEEVRGDIYPMRRGRRRGDAFPFFGRRRRSSSSFRLSHARWIYCLVLLYLGLIYSSRAQTTEYEPSMIPSPYQDPDFCHSNVRVGCTYAASLRREAYKKHVEGEGQVFLFMYTHFCQSVCLFVCLFTDLLRYIVRRYRVYMMYT